MVCALFMAQVKGDMLCPAHLAEMGRAMSPSCVLTCLTFIHLITENVPLRSFIFAFLWLEMRFKIFTVFKNHLMFIATVKLDMEQRTGSKLGKEYSKAVYCHPSHLTSMQSTSMQPSEMLGWMNHKLQSRLSGEISTTSCMQMIPL